MSKTKILLLVAFVAVFVAGITLGLFAGHRQPPRPGPPWLAAELELTQDQVEKMKEIWSKVVPSPHRPSDRGGRSAPASERDNAVREILTADQLDRFERINAEYEAKREQRQKELMAPFDEAMERTQQILTEEQLKRFENLQERMRDREHRRGGPRSRPDDGPQENERGEEQL